ncbi:MAG: putative exported protein [Pseudomonadota bacterium]
MSVHRPFPYSLLPSGRKAGFMLLVLLLSLVAHLFIIQWARDSLALVSLLDDEEDLIQVSLQAATTPQSRAAIPRPPPPPTSAPEKSPPLLPDAPVANPTPAESPPAAPVVNEPAPVTSDRTPQASDTVTETSTANAPAPAPASPVPTSPAQSDVPTTAAPATAESAPATTTDTPPLFSRVSLPPSADLSYDAIAIKGSSKVEGRGLVKWTQDGRQYSINGEASVLFLSVLSYRSEGRLGDIGLLPELYTEKRLGKSSTNTHFHRERQTISFSASTNNYPVKGGEQDRGSVFWQLAGLARGNPDKLQAGLSFELVIAGSRTADPWRVTVHGTEPVALTQGKVDAWHMSLIRPDGGTDYQLEVWVAPGQDWYPVKIMYVDRKGTTLGLTLSKLEKK